jgi:hypothetical protein
MKLSQYLLCFILLFLVLSISSCSSIPNQRTPANFQSCFNLVNNIVNYQKPFGQEPRDFLSSNSLQELEGMYGKESLLDIQKKLTDDDIKKNNDHLKKLLAAPFQFTHIEGKKEIITEEEAQIIYKAMSNSKVHQNHCQYDTQGTIGFCFGRATIAHMEAIVRGVNPDLIRKIWIAGDMGIWGHHVATMIKTEKGWMVLDTNIGKSISPDQWISRYLPYKIKNASEIMVFTTQAGRFGPYDTESYNAINLFNTNSSDYLKSQDYYNGYFHDYFEDLDNTQRKPFFNSDELK